MTTITRTMCLYCKRLNRLGLVKGDKPACLAFPEGIPAGIWYGKRDHRHPIKGDHGFQFDPVDDSNDTRVMLKSYNTSAKETL